MELEDGRYVLSFLVSRARETKKINRQQPLSALTRRYSGNRRTRKTAPLYDDRSD